MIYLLPALVIAVLAVAFIRSGPKPPRGPFRWRLTRRTSLEVHQPPDLRE